MGKISVLWELQQLDIEERELYRQLEDRAETSELEQLASRQEELLTLSQKLRERSIVTLKQAEEAEHVILKETARRESMEEDLYSGKYVSAKELDQMQKKLDHVASHTATLEDQLLEQLLAHEQLERELAAVEALAEENERQLTVAQIDYEQRVADLNNRLHKLVAQRQLLEEGIEASLLKTYRELAPLKKGLAMAAVEGVLCLGCRLALPTGLVGKLITNERLHLCPNCGRILYYGGA